MNVENITINTIKTVIPCRICSGKGEKLAARVRTTTLTMPSIIWSKASTDKATECFNFARRASKIRPTVCPPGNGRVLHEVDMKELAWNSFEKGTKIFLGTRTFHNEVHTNKIDRLNKTETTNHPERAFSISFQVRSKSAVLKNS